MLAAIILLPTFMKSNKGFQGIEADNSTFDLTDTKQVTVNNCLLNDGACEHHSPLFGRVRVEVNPANFPPFKPLSVAVDVESTLVTGVMVSLQGKEMFMGLNSVSLNKLGQQGGWGGSTTIPVCSVDANMIWLVKLTLLGDENEQLIFEVKSTVTSMY